MKPTLKRRAEIGESHRRTVVEETQGCYRAVSGAEECVTAIPELLAAIEELEGEVERLLSEIADLKRQAVETGGEILGLEAEKEGLVEEVEQFTAPNEHWRNPDSPVQPKGRRVMNEATRHENENEKWHCPEGDKLWADLDTDAARIKFLKSGRAISTGIIAPSMVDEIVKIFQRVEKAEADTEAAEVTIERLTILLRERGGDPYKARADLAEAQAVIEQVREVGRNFDCTNPEASKQALCAAFLRDARGGEGG